MSTTASPALAGRYAVDPAASDVTFKTTAWLGLMRVKGHVAVKPGTVSVDDGGEATGRLAFDVTTIDTGIRKRDEHLGREDFFHSSKWPEATFALHRLDTTGDTATVRGELVIRDQPIAVDAPVTIRPTGDARVVEAVVPIDHHAAGLPFRKPVMISGKATVTVRLTLTPA